MSDWRNGLFATEPVPPRAKWLRWLRSAVGVVLAAFGGYAGWISQDDLLLTVGFWSFAALSLYQAWLDANDRQRQPARCEAWLLMAMGPVLLITTIWREGPAGVVMGLLVAIIVVANGCFFLKRNRREP